MTEPTTEDEGERMREMTTAEFAKANLAALEEPVKIRRYTKTVGTYYPEGYIASVEGMPLTTGFAPIIPETSPDLVAAEKLIKEKNDEIARLKKELAARAVPPARPEHPLKDVFSNLAKQDREFFERKLGTGKKK